MLHTHATCSLLGAGVPEAMIKQEVKKKKAKQKKNIGNYYHNVSNKFSEPHVLSNYVQSFDRLATCN